MVTGHHFNRISRDATTDEWPTPFQVSDHTHRQETTPTTKQAKWSYRGTFKIAMASVPVVMEDSCLHLKLIEIYPPLYQICIQLQNFIPSKCIHYFVFYYLELSSCWLSVISSRPGFSIRINGVIIFMILWRVLWRRTHHVDQLHGTCWRLAFEWGEEKSSYFFSLMLPLLPSSLFLPPPSFLFLFLSSLSLPSIALLIVICQVYWWFH